MIYGYKYLKEETIDKINNENEANIIASEEVINNEETEVINEETLFSSQNLLIIIEPSANRNYGKDAYFKIYNNSSYKKSDKEARIKVFSP